MKLDTIAMLLVIVAVALYFGFLLLAGTLALFPLGITLIVLLSVAVTLLIGVIWQRGQNAEDEYYDRNIER